MFFLLINIYLHHFDHHSQKFEIPIIEDEEEFHQFRNKAHKLTNELLKQSGVKIHQMIISSLILE
jgi:bifunctional DNase/RNase